ncbi:hypothetical protein XENTR_v10014428 [Xenopus tropicalis]|nr:hypothetical protein XENTR_v10014428 [Xenopus tropicalis]
MNTKATHSSKQVVMMWTAQTTMPSKGGTVQLSKLKMSPSLSKRHRTGAFHIDTAAYALLSSGNAPESSLIDF